MFVEANRNDGDEDDDDEWYDPSGFSGSEMETVSTEAVVSTSWSTMDVQALCDKLVGNDATLNELVITLKDVGDAEVNLILAVAKRTRRSRRWLLTEAKKEKGH